MQGAHLPAAKVHDLRTPYKELTSRGNGAALGGLVQLCRRHAVNGGPRFGQLEAIGARQHELRIVKANVSRVAVR